MLPRAVDVFARLPPLPAGTVNSPKTRALLSSTAVQTPPAYLVDGWRNIYYFIPEEFLKMHLPPDNVSTSRGVCAEEKKKCKLLLGARTAFTFNPGDPWYLAPPA